MTRNVRDRQIARSYIRCNAHHVIGNFARQFDGNRAVNGALVITIELANLERRTLNLGQILGCRIEGDGPRCHATAFNYAHRPAGDVFDLDRTRRHVQVKRCERVGNKRFARKLLRPSGIVTAIQGIVLVKRIAHTRQAGYNIVEIPRSIKMNQSPRNAKDKPDDEHKRSDANAQAPLRLMRELHHSSPSLALDSAVVAAAMSASTAVETSSPLVLATAGAGPT